MTDAIQTQTHLLLPWQFFRQSKELSLSELRVYLSLSSSANQETGEYSASLKELAKMSNLSYGSVAKAITNLESKDLIIHRELPEKGKEKIFVIKNYKSFSQNIKNDTQKVTNLEKVSVPVDNLGVNLSLNQAKNQTPEKNSHLGESTGNTGIDNRNIINTAGIGKERESEREGNHRSHLNFIPKTKQESLALEIAKEFREVEHLPLYLFFCNKYPEAVIRRAYGEAKETKEENIKKSRGALFIYLVQKYAKEQQ